MHAKDSIANCPGALMNSPGNLWIESLSRDEALHHHHFAAGQNVIRAS
jgi:hypothetical protein